MAPRRRRPLGPRVAEERPCRTFHHRASLDTCLREALLISNVRRRKRSCIPRWSRHLTVRSTGSRCSSAQSARAAARPGLRWSPCSRRGPAAPTQLTCCCAATITRSAVPCRAGGGGRGDPLPATALTGSGCPDRVPHHGTNGPIGPAQRLWGAAGLPADPGFGSLRQGDGHETGRCRGRYGRLRPVIRAVEWAASEAAAEGRDAADRIRAHAAAADVLAERPAGHPRLSQT